MLSNSEEFWDSQDGWEKGTEGIFHSSPLTFSLLFSTAQWLTGSRHLKLHLVRKVFWRKREKTGKTPLHELIFPLYSTSFCQTLPLTPSVTSPGPSPAAWDRRALTSRPLSDRTRTDCAPKYFSKSSFSSAVSSAGRCLTKRVRSPRGGESEAELWHPLDIGGRDCSGAAISRNRNTEGEKRARSEQALIHRSWR